jgi:DNA-binding NarL/FixJ family response regulator
MTKIRVLLADDHAVVRDGLRALLDAAPGIEVVGQAADGLEVIQLATELAPDVVVMDITMPRVNGIEATRRIVKAVPGTRVLILSQHEDIKYVLEAVRAGAAGYLLKRDAGADLAEGIRALHRWGAVLHPHAARAMIDAHLECTCCKQMDSYEHLTDREREVLILVAEGYTTPQIAEALHVSRKTVDGHRTSLMSKLDLHDRTEVVKYALRRQLIEL